jgi:hypothetical protein
MRPPERGWTLQRNAAGALAVRHQGLNGRIEVVDGGGRPWAARLRDAEAALRTMPGDMVCVRDGQLERPTRPGRWARPPARRVLFFESLMNAELPHNDGELSQGVLHMISSLAGTPTEVVLANVKMAIVGTDRPVAGLDTLVEALAGAPFELVCITLLEGYWDGVVSLIRTLRELGCRAHVAVGGVLPTLAPDAVAAHLPDVSFVCRGAGERFLPSLIEILGAGACIDTELDGSQVAALLRLDGLYVRDTAGDRLLVCNSAAVLEVPDLDAVRLDLRHLEARHFATGIEIASSRGCVHRCVFCSILGRERYQSRSAENLAALLTAYDTRLRELFGDDVPRTARRVHFSDDDFACDRDRALAVFRSISSTPFRLASVQVSIADLCRREGGRLLAEPDAELLDAIRPECFDDADRPLPEADFVADHRTRKWSSYLQIGVETFSDPELVRLGKGYKREHVRVIVAELARRRIHHDAYFILANRDTSFADLVAVLDEVVRQKTLFPVHFHIRFPVVPRLVSYATSASWRRRVQQGDEAAFFLRGRLHEPGYPEFDYPLVDHDEPRDPLVRAHVHADGFTDTHRYAGTFTLLRERLVAAWSAVPDPDTEYAARLCDDRERRRLFELLDLARRVDHVESSASEATRAAASPALMAALRGKEATLRARCDQRLGPTRSWLPAFQRYAQGGVTRLVVIPTWQCELRCNYCTIPKQDGRVMTERTLTRAVDLLCSSEREALTLQFFGGEALLEWGLVQHAIGWGSEQAARRGKKLDFVLSSNGWSLDAEKLAWLRGRPVKLELSLDGARATQLRYRPAAKGGADSYQNGVAPRAGDILQSGLAYDVIMVVHPEVADTLAANFQHIMSLGFRRIQINHALGKRWSQQNKSALARELLEVSRTLDAHPDVTLVNAEHPPMPMRLNGEITVDWDGTVYAGNAFLHETENKAHFRRGHLDDLHNFDRYWMDAPGNAELLAWSYPTDITANNLAVAAIMTDFLRWLRDRPARTGGAGLNSPPSR